MKTKIFIIEDEPDMLELLDCILTKENFEVYKYYSGTNALKDIEDIKPNIVLLDLMLPDLSGLEICKRIKENSKTKNTPVIIISSRNDEYDILNGFNFGCSDYITKPFSEKILVARIKACLIKQNPCCSLCNDNNSILSFNNLKVDPSKFEVTIKSRIIDLTPLEFKLLHFLAKNKERVFKRDQIFDEIYENDDIRSDRSIDILVNRIRKKLGKYGEYIETIYGVGYTFKIPF